MEVQPAGLGAPAPVAAALPQHGGKVALAGKAHAQGPVDKGLQGDLLPHLPVDGGDLRPGKLPGQHDTAKAQGLHGPGSGGVVDRKLGAGVEGEGGAAVPGQPGHPQVLDDEGVGAALGDLL